MKKIVCILVLFCVIIGAAFAQQKKPATPAPAAPAPAAAKEIKNWISGEVSLFGSGVRYERMLNKNFSIGGATSWNTLILWNAYGVSAAVRFYPMASGFFAGLDLGYGTITGTEDVTDKYGSHSWLYATSGFMVTPGVGWKIDFGDPGGFFICPMITLPVVFGKKNYDEDYSVWPYAAQNGGTSEFKVGVHFRAAFGLGFAF